MIVVPSVDIKDGRCVKLVQGKPGTGIVVSDDPVKVAEHWISEGAEVLHVVDLDGAIYGERRNSPIVSQILKEVSIPVQVGGGIRTVEDALTVLSEGASWVILGTAAVENRDFVKELARAAGPERVIVSLDSRRGRVLKHGWRVEAGGSLIQWARTFENLGLAGFLFTDVKVEGTMEGIRLNYIKELVNATRIPVLYAGGISSLDDLARLAETGVHGVVVGMALYEGRFSLKEAQELAENARRRA